MLSLDRRLSGQSPFLLRGGQQIRFAGEFQCFQSRAASACCIAVRHDVNWDIGLLFALNAHSDANLVDEPLLEFRARLDHTAAHDQSIRVEGVDHLIKNNPSARA
jgi:hypothetical protein